MKTFKISFILIIAFLSQMVLADEWKHQNLKVQGSEIRISYTTSYLPATYGSEGGQVAALFYIDVNSERAAVIGDAEIYEILKDGRMRKNSSVKINEDNANHHYGKKSREITYGDFLWYKRQYLLKIVIDGRIAEMKFSL